MKRFFSICAMLAISLSVAVSAKAQSELKSIAMDFYGDSVAFAYHECGDVQLEKPLNQNNIFLFYQGLDTSGYQPLVQSLLDYKKKYNPDDWMFYQYVRRLAEYISPKSENYERYTLYKWFLLSKSGYDARIRISGSKILFYVQSQETIYDIPYFLLDNRQYVCLNYHDYGYIDFKQEEFADVNLSVPAATKAFSYKLTQLPSFRPEDYREKELEFSYRDEVYRFRVQLNTQVKQLFANYPVADYPLYFGAPLSSGTYNSLIPQLKKNVKGLSVKNGVDYLMHFTRYAFLYRPDQEYFGKEKRLSPEQTLLSEYSDCEDRAALFFYLVKEIYNLPMIVLAFPRHVTIAVKLDKPVGKPVMYNGAAYSVCEPTPQATDLSIGSRSLSLHPDTYDIVYAYQPGK